MGKRFLMDYCAFPLCFYGQRLWLQPWHCWRACY
nr:MAG TPA: hypothetical protein [Caudoviricetes sp.]